MSNVILGADIGGTGMKINLFDSGRRELLLTNSLRTATQASDGPEQACWKLAKLAHEAAKTAGISFKDIAAIGVSTPGPCDYQSGVYLSSPNLDSWSGFDLKSAIEKIMGLPAYFINDGSAATLAEKQLGVGSDKKSIALLTVGTGIGGGYANQDGLFYDDGYFANYSTEFGHILIADPYDSRSRVCSCEAKGHLEAYASFSAMISRTEEMIVKSPTLVDLSSWQDAENKGEFIVLQANQGSKFFQDICCESASYLAAGFANIANSFAPEVMVIGGGATKFDEFYLRTVVSTFKGLIPKNWSLQREIPIVNALLENKAGVIGAALYTDAAISC